MKLLKMIILAILIVVINLIWEFSHYRLYIDLTDIPSAFHIIIASFTDLFLMFLIFLIISIFRKNIIWIDSPKKTDYFFIIFLGMLFAIVIEAYSLSKGRWSYKSLMPTIFGIGISPLIQLFTTFIVSLLIIRIINKEN